MASCDTLHRVSDLEGSCEHGDEHPGSIKGGEFLEEVDDCKLF
jgi:hypothetical protein